MTSNQFRTFVVIGIVLFFLSCINMCSSCTTKSALLEFEKSNSEKFAAEARSRASDKIELGLQMQTLAPEISNMFLGYFNAEQYKGVIQINGEKIKNLNLQLQNIKSKVDSTKKNR